MIKVMLNTEIYSIEKIEKTCSIYSDLAKIYAEQEGNYIVLTFDECKLSEKLTIQEFENYLIAEENMQHGNN